MCVICVSKKGVKQPTKETMKAMWDHNSHGAGYMFQRGEHVYIRKGFMTFDAFYEAVKKEHFTKNDAVVYHFRISTQGGINPQMTQPFFYTKDIENTRALKARARLGICHNGIIPMTSFTDPVYSDTAHFVAEYLPVLVRTIADVHKESVQKLIKELIHSRMAFLDCHGDVALVGDFITEPDGLIYSNSTFRSYRNLFDNYIAV